MSISKPVKKEKSLLEIIHIIFKRKLVLVFSILVSLILAYLYSQNATPVFESKAMLKKEMADRKQAANDFYEIVKLQTQDEVDTELELVKTSEVLGGIVNELKLNINLIKIETPNRKIFELKNVFIDFPDSGNIYSKIIGHSLPVITDLKMKSNESKARRLYIKKNNENEFELRNAEDNVLLANSKLTSKITDENAWQDQLLETDSDSLIQTQSVSSKVKFVANSLEFNFSWNDAPIGSKIYFDIDNFYTAINKLSGQISVSKVGKTNVFQMSVRSASPFAAVLIAGSLIDRFREVRIEQQKQTIKYSFKFVDEQLEEVKIHLLEAENNLSDYKASGQIISVDESSRELISYLSTLEAEKLRTDLLLSDYKNKAEDLKKELESSGYFDQSYLDMKGTEANSPFSNLLKQVSDLELQRLELLQKRSENHPDVKNIDEQIKSTKEKLAGYNQNTITSYQMMVNSFEKKLLKITNLMSRYEQRMQKLPAQESQLARLLRQKDVYEKIFTLLLDKREEMRIAEVSKLQDIIVVDPPQKPLKPISPNKIMNMMVALVLGGFIGLVLIFVLELKDNRLVNVDDLEDDFQLPVLAIVPKYSREMLKRINNASENRDRFASLMDDTLGIKESLRLLKTKILFQLDSNDKIILVTSCEENTGKTTLVANLAITFAQENKKVLIIDCDLKKAELSKLFNLPLDTPGLVDYLTSEIPPSVYTKVMKKIDIIPAGGLRDDSAALLDSNRMKVLLDTLNTSEYDYVIIDTPPVTRVVDTLVLGRMVKNALLVVRPDMSFKETVSTGIQEMKQAKFKVRGIIANAVDIKKSYTYRYKYGYGYGYSSSGGNGKTKTGLKASLFKETK